MTRNTHPDLDFMYKSLYKNQGIAHQIFTRFVDDVEILNHHNS